MLDSYQIFDGVKIQVALIQKRDETLGTKKREREKKRTKWQRKKELLHVLTMI